MKRLPLIVLCFAALSFAQNRPPAAPVGPPEPEPTFPELARADRVLAEGLADKNPDTRKEVVGSLSLAGSREPYLAQIHGALEDKDMYVRLAAVASLVDLEKKNAAPGLIKALYDEAPEVSFAAAKALWALGDATGRAALLGVISGDTTTASGPLTSQKRDMLRMLKTPRSLMMFALREGVGFVPVPGVGEGMSSLMLLAADQGASGRSASLLLVAHDPNPEIVKALRESLRDKDAAVRASAVHSIAVRDDPTFLTELIPLMDDAKQPVRFRAAAGYIRLAGIQKAQWEERQKARMKAMKPAGKKK